MPLLGDRVQESTTTGGTGTLTLAGAVTGYRTFNSVFSNGDVVYYTIDDGAGNWEVGYGTVGTGTLTRSVVLDSSNAGSLVNFTAGTAKRVFCTAPSVTLLPDQTSNSGKVLTTNGSIPSWTTPASGTVTAVSVATANGLAGTSSGGATPALTLSTTVTGVLKGNGTAISAAVSGTDYAPATSGTSILYGNGSGGFSNVTVGTGLSFSTGTLSATGGTGTVTSVSGTGTVSGISLSGTVTSSGSLTLGGSLDLSAPPAIGGTTPAAGTFTTLSSTGNTTLGDASADTVTFNAATVTLNNSTTISAASTKTLTLNGGAGSNGLVLDASNNVGIGTSSPSFALDIATALANIRLASSTGTNSCLFRLTNTGGTAYIGLDNSSGGVAASYALTMYHGGAYPIIFSTSGTERARIDSSGNLLVGATSSSGPGTARFQTGDTNSASSIVAKSNTAHALIYASSSVDSYFGWNASGALLLGQGPVNGSTFTERARIDSSGYLLVGYTSSNGAYKLQVNSQIFATSAIIATSDANYKTNVKPISSGLSLINALNPVQFNWKAHEVHAFDVEQLTVGFLAQEVEAVLKDTEYAGSIVYKNECELPDGSKEEFLGLADGKMIPLLVAAIKELSAELNELKQKVNA